MANWNEIKTNVGTAAGKTLRAAGELADIAKLNIKVKALSVKLSGKFEKLGRLTYKQLKTETSYAEDIAVVIADIDGLRADIKALKEEIELAKQARAEAKRERQEDCDACADEGTEE